MCYKSSSTTTTIPPPSILSLAGSLFTVLFCTIIWVEAPPSSMAASLIPKSANSLQAPSTIVHTVSRLPPVHGNKHYLAVMLYSYGRLGPGWSKVRPSRPCQQPPPVHPLQASFRIHTPEIPAQNPDQYRFRSSPPLQIFLPMKWAHKR